MSFGMVKRGWNFLFKSDSYNEALQHEISQPEDIYKVTYLFRVDMDNAISTHSTSVLIRTSEEKSAASFVDYIGHKGIISVERINPKDINDDEVVHNV